MQALPLLRRLRRLTLWCAAGLISASASLAAQKGPKLPIGQFVAARTTSPPTMDGKLEAGEWGGALISSGMMTPFDMTLQEAQTTVGFTFDEERLYFLFECIRGDREWKLEFDALYNPT